MSGTALSIVSPVYRSPEIVRPLVERIVAACSGVQGGFELVLVEDASPDSSWDEVVAAAASDPRVRGIRLARNFGQHAAIAAGLANAAGEHVVVMDCDLQDDPSYIPALLAKARGGYDVVLTRMEERKHSRFRNLGAGAYLLLSGQVSRGKAGDLRLGGYSVLSRRAVGAFLRAKDARNHYLAVVRGLGLPTAEVPVRRQARASGRSSYTLGKLVRHALDGLASRDPAKRAPGCGPLYLVRGHVNFSAPPR
jgi:dolichol-phosphate mannosyltransferase